MITPEHVANGTFQTVDGSPTGWSGSTAKRDFGILAAESANDTTTTLATPASFVELGQQGLGTAGAAGSVRLALFYALATSAAPSAPTLTDPGDHIFSVISSFRGVYIGGAPVLVGFQTGTGTAVTFLGGETFEDNALVVHVVAHARDASGASVSSFANAGLTSVTEIFDNGSTTGHGGGIAMATGEKATAGTFVGGTATLSASVNWVSATIVLNGLVVNDPPDVTPPEIVDFGPVPVDPRQPITWRVLDETGLRSVVVLASFPGSGIDAETVYDSEGFRGLYRNASGTVSGTATDKVFTALRSGGWPEPPVLEFVVTDTSGNLGVLG